LGEYQDVNRCFTDRTCTWNDYKVWVAKQRHIGSYWGGKVGRGEEMFPAQALLELRTFHGCFVFMCGVKQQQLQQQQGGDDDCLLRKLDHVGIKAEIIASYLDFPKGLELEELLVAAPQVAPTFLPRCCTVIPAGTS
jgi:hypothetical protein